METNDKNIFSNMSKDEAIAVLILLAYDKAFNEARELWNEFQHEIKENSRFFPKARLLDIIHDMKDDAIYELKEGDIFYRARVFHDFFLEHNKKEMKEFEAIVTSHYPELKGKSCEEMNYVINNSIPFFNRNMNEEIVTLLKKRKKFWGYNAKDSGAPPKGGATAGRANSSGISYLYICDSSETAVMEVRPRIGQDVSVATIEIKEPIKLFDFCNEDDIFQNGGDAMLYKMVSMSFSEPYKGNEKDYYPTQYLCEYIKELGFEGIRYYSSLDSNAKDIVIFNTLQHRKYEILCSKVHKINGYHIDMKQIAPCEG